MKYKIYKYIYQEFLMQNILIIGFNELSEKIIKHIKKNTDFNIMGYDFDVDIAQSYKEKKYIINQTNHLSLLLKKTDILILNIEFLKYQKLIEFLPFIKEETLILNTNIYKNNFEEIKEIFKNKSNNFIPCNFILFPDNIILSYDNQAKMQAISKASQFFQEFKIPTSVLKPDENNDIFSKLFQIPFIFDKILFKNTELNFISDKKEYFNYDIFYEGILLNKKNVLLDLELILDYLPDVNDKNSIQKLFNIKMDLLDKIELEDLEINENIVSKIILEKIFMKIINSKKLNDYIDLNLIQFDYKNYDDNFIKYYIQNHKNILEMILISIKEKIINLSSFLSINTLSLSKFKRYL